MYLLPGWSRKGLTQFGSPDHQAILLSNIPRLVLATYQACKTVTIYKTQNKSQEFCNFILKIPSKLLNGCNLVATIHCQSLGNSLNVCKIDYIRFHLRWTQVEVGQMQGEMRHHLRPQGAKFIYIFPHTHRKGTGC